MVKRARTSAAKFKISTYKAITNQYETTYTSLTIIAKGDSVTIDISEAQYVVLHDFLNMHDSAAPEQKQEN